MTEPTIDDALQAKIAELSAHKDRDWARQHFLNVVRELVEIGEAETVLEIGGGRFPAFKKHEIETMGIRYTTSDILASELDRAPDWVDKFQFDITTTEQSLIDAHRGRYDFAFSKWVMEHVADYRRAYTNIHAVLADGGVHIAWHPILFSPPFVLNKLLPEAVASTLLRTFFPHRNDEETPKFPAHYSGCRISSRVRSHLRSIGFRDVWQLPFYGHGYYEKIPAVREIHRGVARAMRDANLTALASFAFTIVRK
jgi:hypothetical protein